MLITTIIGYFYYQKDSSNYLCGKTKGIFLALIFIIVFYYTYSGILGNHIAIIDISSFMIATVIGEFYAYKNIQSNTLCNNLISVIILFIISLCFIIFTFYPPNIGIFKDPSTKNVNITD